MSTRVTVPVDSGLAGKPDEALQRQAEEILRQAAERGVDDNYFFTTTFQRYQVQLEILAQLEEAIRQTGPVVTKTYVKGRENVCTNPAIMDYNRTSTSANQTVDTLMKIIDKLGRKEPVQKESNLARMLRAANGDDAL